MRILHVCNPVNIPAKHYGGTQKVVYSLAKKQAEDGHHVAIMAGEPSSILGVQDVSFVKGRPYSERKFIINRNVTAYLLRAFLKSRRFDFDIVHCHVSEEAIPLSIFARCPVITTLHCPMTLRKFWPFVTTSVSSFLPKKTKFVTISHRAFNAYRPFYEKDLLNYIRSSIDSSSIPFNSEPNKQHDIQLCFVGKLVYEKMPHLAIKVVDILQEMNYDAKLFIMGKLDNRLSAYTKKLVDMAQTRPYVELSPNIETKEMYRIIGNCDVFINTSFEMGLMLSQLEALAAGTPVVGFVGGVAEEVVSNGLTGYLGLNLDDVAKKCIAALDLDRKTCRKYVEENFNEQKMYEDYMHEYDRTLQLSR